MQRLRNSGRLAAGIMGFITTLSVAFFVGSYLGDGSHTGTVGSGGTGTKTLPVKVNFPDGELTPTHPIEVQAEVENTTGKAVKFTRIQPTVTTGAAGCQASWFRLVAKGFKAGFWNGILSGQAGELEYATGTRRLIPEVEMRLWLELEETGTDQSACEGAPVTVALHLT